MDATQPDVAQLRLRSKTLDSALIGTRLKQARLRLGLTQTQAAGEEMSTAYISRIEAGQRRAGFGLLETLAPRLGLTLEELLEEPSHSVQEEADRLAFELTGVELSLSTGDPHGALAQVMRLLEQPSLPPEIDLQARYQQALALEATDRLSDAVRRLEDLVETSDNDLLTVRAMTALSRCYREEGDFARACEVGDRARILLDDDELSGSVEGVRLAVTVAAAFHERGDVHHALRLCQRALEVAERNDSWEAQAAAYWNTGMMHAERGDFAAARSLAQRAVLLFERADDARNMARLRAELGSLLLQQDVPEVEGAMHNLDLALQDMTLSGASLIDRVRVRLDMARARLLVDDTREAETIATACLRDLGDLSPQLRAEARTIIGRSFADRDIDAAKACYRQAVMDLSEADSDRRVAQLWYELGDLLQTHGETDTALQAFRSAAASSGLRQSAPVRAEVQLTTESLQDLDG